MQHVIHVFNSSVVSGPEVLVLPALAKLALDPEYKVAVIFLVESRVVARVPSPPDYARRLGLKVTEVKVESRLDLGAIRRLRGELEGADLIHAHDVKASLYTLFAIKFINRGQPPFPRPILVSTHHGVIGRKGLKLKTYESIYVRTVLPFYNAVIAVCKSDQDNLKGRGLSAARVHLQLNGATRTKWTQEMKLLARARIHTRWEMSKDVKDKPLVLGMVARLSSEKRHDRALTVLAELVKQLPKLEWQLLCFGSAHHPAELAALKQQTLNLGLTGRVKWMGYSPTIAEDMACLDWLLCFSDGEGLPVSFLEAAWARTPIFSSAVGGIPDLLDDGVTGVLFDREMADTDVARKLGNALSGPGAEKKARELADNLQKRVETQFSEAAWLNQLKAIYRREMGSQNPKGHDTDPAKVSG